MEEAQAMIAQLGLAPHPEGGWYRETWRADAVGSVRVPGTAILFLLEAGQRSHWHRVDADELWLWHAGSPLDLHIEDGHGRVSRIALGGMCWRGRRPRPEYPPAAGRRPTRQRAGVS